MKSITHAICAVITVALGMLGLYVHIEYSGWVLLVGLLWASGS